MQIIGLTGAIGSGKTTVANLFAKLGTPIIDADVIAHQITESSTPLWQNLTKKFGITTRQQLRELIFNHPDKRHELEKILHPLILEEIKKQLKNLKNHVYCIVVIPLLIETGPYDFIDRIIVVDSTEEECMERAKKRDQTTAEAIQKMLQTQIPREKRLALANNVIQNHSDLASLEEQVKALNESILI